MSATADSFAGGWITDLRGGVLLQDADVINRDLHFAPFSQVDEDGVALNLAVIFAPPGFLRWAGEPRPYFNMSISTSGGTSLWAGGLTWGHQFDFGLYLDGFLGIAANDGTIDEGGVPGTKEMGSWITPHFALEVGYRFDAEKHHGLSLYLEHISHAEILNDVNDSLDNWGLRYSYRF